MPEWILLFRKANVWLLLIQRHFLPVSEAHQENPGSLILREPEREKRSERRMGQPFQKEFPHHFRRCLVAANLAHSRQGRRQM
ncbi:MAG: hypothetical protein K2N82_14280 [Lachnospiraceae bacterium]|nr:hypothetical protein [Lachnospiraceae bacterium]